jgi:hypothetical protein
MNEELEIIGNDDYMTVYNITPQNQHLLKVPNTLWSLYIHGDYLDHFEIPQGIKYVEIKNLGLKTLYIPDGTINVNCSNNFLKTIEIPQSLITLKANKNLLTEIIFRSPNFNQLEDLDIRSNKFKYLDFVIPKKFCCLNASKNNILSIGPNIKYYLSNDYKPENCKYDENCKSDEKEFHVIEKKRSYSF